MTKKIETLRVKSFLQHKLATDPNYATRALVVIFNRQTEDEKRIEATKYTNFIGFTGCDAEILTSFAKQWLSRNWLSDKQMYILHKKIVRYWRQLWDASDKVKLWLKIEGEPVPTHRISNEGSLVPVIQTRLPLYDEDKAI